MKVKVHTSRSRKRMKRRHNHYDTFGPNLKLSVSYDTYIVYPCFSAVSPFPFSTPRSSLPPLSPALHPPPLQTPAHRLIQVHPFSPLLATLLACFALSFMHLFIRASVHLAAQQLQDEQKQARDHEAQMDIQRRQHETEVRKLKVCMHRMATDGGEYHGSMAGHVRCVPVCASGGGGSGGKRGRGYVEYT
jgi:hypothetical protein